jgi:regulator of protease activity HflC (stomatin/prohibitin superfamily)
MITFLTVAVLFALFILWNTVVIVPMREEYIIERLGKYLSTLKPGLYFLIPFFDRIAYRHEIREQVIDIPSQSCISKDNMQIEVDGLVYLKVNDAKRASYGIEDYRVAAINLAQTTMRSEVGKLTLSQTFSERETLNETIVKEIDRASDAWGVKVLRYEIMNITPSNHVVATLEQQMEAEREKRAEITLALAEKESRINLSEGQRQEAINLSEGAKTKRINEAKGKAKEIELLAEATSKGIAMVAEAINKRGGKQAVDMQLFDQFIDELGEILSQAKVSILPNEMANIKGVFEGFNKMSETVVKK